MNTIYILTAMFTCLNAACFYTGMRDFKTTLVSFFMWTFITAIYTAIAFFHLYEKRTKVIEKNMEN